jgi:hypothetical protein
VSINHQTRCPCRLALRIGHVPLPARNQVNVGMANSLPPVFASDGCFSALSPPTSTTTTRIRGHQNLNSRDLTEEQWRRFCLHGESRSRLRTNQTWQSSFISTPAIKTSYLDRFLCKLDLSFLSGPPHLRPIPHYFCACTSRSNLRDTGHGP